MMAEKEDRTTHMDHSRRVRQAKRAGIPTEGNDRLEYLKQQYIEGDLTEAEFEQRLEQLDSLEEPVADTEAADPRAYLFLGWWTGIALGVAVGVGFLVYTLVSAAAGSFAGATVLGLLGGFVWGWWR